MADAERVRFEMLSKLAYEAPEDVSEAQLQELERLEDDHPEWRDEVAAEPPVASIRRVLETFTAEEVDQIARSQNCSVQTLRRRWIIQRAYNYYVIGLTGEYRSPLIRAELAVSLPRDLSRVPSVTGEADVVPDGHISWEKKYGALVVPKTVDDLLASYSTVARRVVASMSIKHSFYDPEHEIFYERACPQRPDVAPAYDENVDRWMSLLGGEKLKDWVATATFLDRPTCAIYLHACKDAGKTMFAAGLSRIWSEAPTEMDSAYDTFNSAISDNPLIFADEEFPRGLTSGFLRKFVGQGTHPLRRKNMPEAKILGCFRLVIAANNPDLLKFDDEDFTAEDIDAIAARILYVRSDPGAAEFLRSLGGRAGTGDWVDGDRIARYALWLRDNRVVARGKRFLVEGRITDIHRRIAMHGSIRGLVIEWVCAALLKANWMQKNPGIRHGGGRLYVNAGFVKETWEQVLGDNRVPSLKKIGLALKPLAKGEKRLAFGNRRADFYEIDADYIYDVARDLQLGVVDDYRTIINRPVLVEDDSPPPLPLHGGGSGLFSS